MTVASVHALAPDHGIPLAALARAQEWTAPRTARIAVACAFAHVTVSVVIGTTGLALDSGSSDQVGATFEPFAGFLLIGFGLLYRLWV